MIAARRFANVRRCRAVAVGAVVAALAGLSPGSATASTTNVGGGSVSFTVTVTPQSLCNLTQRFARASTRYQGLSAKQKASFDKSLDGLCATTLDPITPGVKPGKKQGLIAAYKDRVAGLAGDGYVTSAQAAELASFSSAL